MASQPAFLIVVDRRELVLRCMSSWLSTFRREFEVTSVLDAEKSLRPGEVARAGAVIIGVSAPSLPNPWLEQQVTWLFDKRADVPIIAITDAGQAAVADTFAADLNLRGYISTSSKIDVAAAALRLVLAGGTYLPRQREPEQPPVEVPLEQILRENATELLRTLTPRERGVLEFLQRGMANKTIAYRLNMSSSTVKVHVHNIMVKLNARNRTEVAVAASRFVNSSAATDIEAKPRNRTASPTSFESSSVPHVTAPDRLHERGLDGKVHPQAHATTRDLAAPARNSMRQPPVLLSAVQQDE
ncbi:MAG TPA: response regulator transcription factor [Stellaceae bacterium]|nr:response regulator transcription factor [Stellaceae bacterium]